MPLATQNQVTQQNGFYDTPTGYGGRIDTSTGRLVSASDIGTQPMALRQVTPATGSSGLSDYLGTLAGQSNDQFSQDLATETDATKAPLQSSFRDYISSIVGTKGTSELTSDQYSAAGVNDAQKELKEINSRILADQVATQRRIETLKQNANGVYGGALEQEIQTVQDESTRRQADLAIVQMSKQGQYDSAKEIADRAVSALTERQKNVNDTLRFIYEENKDQFTKAEKRQFETAQADRNRKLEFEQYQLKARFDEKIKQQDPLYQAQLAKARLEGNGGGTYIAGANKAVDAWANRIQSGQAKITDIPASQKGMRDAVTLALDAMGNSLDGKPTVTELGKAALTTANTLLSKFNEGKGTSAVGKSGFLNTFGYGLIPGTDRANFATDFQSLKDQLSLEGVKYLKGQGQVSDAERALLASAVTKLNLSQSEPEFKTTLEGIISKLNGASTSAKTSSVITAPDGTQIEIID